MAQSCQIGLRSPTVPVGSLRVRFIPRLESLGFSRFGYKKSLEESVRDLTKKIFEAKNKKERLKMLLNQKGFGLAMSTAVLTILYPEVFTVYDYRVRNQLKNPKTGNHPYPDISSLTEETMINKYFDEYVKRVKQTGRQDKDPKLSLRDCDRLLWAKSQYKDLQEFLAK